MNIENYKSQLASIEKLNMGCAFIIRHKENPIYITPNFYTYFGNPISINRMYLEQHIHPSDLSSFLLIRKKFIDFICKQPVNQRMDYSQMYEFRVMTEQKKYIRVTSHHRIVDIDVYGNPTASMVWVQIAPNQFLEEGLKFHCVNSKTGIIIPAFQMNDNILLTKREKEVLKMSSLGFMTKEIAEQLYISIHTVNRHKQNILQKLNANNILEAIDIARKKEMLSS